MTNLPKKKGKASQFKLLSNSHKALMILHIANQAAKYGLSKKNLPAYSKMFIRLQNNHPQAGIVLERALANPKRALASPKSSLLYRAGLFVLALKDPAGCKEHLASAIMEMTGMSNKKARLAIKKLQTQGLVGKGNP